MPAVCLYFQVHQPFRIRRFRFAEVGSKNSYFDETKNAFILEKVSRKSYLKANKVMLELISRYGGSFRICFSISGVAIEQMRTYQPEVLESFQNLVATGCVELLSETSHHTLASLYDQAEFLEEIEIHRQMMREYFDYSPSVFRNTELIYNDQIGQMIFDLGFEGILAEGADDILGWRSPNFVYRHPNLDLKILTKNYKLSDDIAFRFSNRSWNSYPLTSEKFANWVHALSGCGDTVNLFMDYETFGEHQWEDTGIFEFLRYLPEAILKHRDWEFLTPSQILAKIPSVAPLSFGRTVSWADLERDTSAWNGNEMQKRALKKAFGLVQAIKNRSDNPSLLKTWRRLLTSDHFYYMCTKFFSDGDVHAYFSPFKNPYEAFLSYMSILEDLELSFKAETPIEVRVAL